jgi:hypothetical protein
VGQNRTSAGTARTAVYPPKADMPRANPDFS